MLIFEHGNIVTGDYPIFCHQVNCQGVMGAGLAKQIRDRYPEVYDEYYKECMSANRLLGRIIPVVTSDKRICINMFAQDGYGRNGCYTDYEAFKDCLDNLKEFLSLMHQSPVAFPYGIACGLGGGNWNTIHDMLSDFASEIDKDVVIVRL